MIDWLRNNCLEILIILACSIGFLCFIWWILIGCIGDDIDDETQRYLKGGR